MSKGVYISNIEEFLINHKNELVVTYKKYSNFHDINKILYLKDNIKIFFTMYELENCFVVNKERRVYYNKKDDLYIVDSIWDNPFVLKKEIGVNMTIKELVKMYGVENLLMKRNYYLIDKEWNNILRIEKRYFDRYRIDLEKNNNDGYENIKYGTKLYKTRNGYYKTKTVRQLFFSVKKEYLRLNKLNDV